MSFEMPQPIKENNERYFEWKGKQFEHDSDNALFSIKKGELSEFEIEAFKKELKRQFPDAEYVLVRQPYVEAAYDVFERIEEGEVGDSTRQTHSEKHDTRKNDIPRAA